MKSSVYATAFGLAAVASATTYNGFAQVVNSCDHPVYLQDVPALGTDGVVCNNATLQPGEAYNERHWMPLNTGGFSIKLATYEIDAYASENIIQYEWNMDAPPTIWWDISNVNDPDNSTLPTWSPFSSSSCGADFKTYMYPDDNSAMQAACDDTDTVLTILLCSDSDSAADNISKYNLKGSGSAVSSVASSATSSAKATSTSVAASSTSKAAASTTSSVEAYSTISSVEAYSTSSAEASSSSSISSYAAVEKVVASPTTLATSAASVSSSAEAVSSPATTASADSNVVWVTDIQTAWQTDHVVHTVVVDGSGNTVTENKHKRHEHRHPHGRHH